MRLYNSKTLTQAKTAIPGLGSPITALDVTYDGKYVLATTDKYLMVIKTTFTNDKVRAVGWHSGGGRRGCCAASGLRSRGTPAVSMAARRGASALARVRSCAAAPHGRIPISGCVARVCNVRTQGQDTNAFVDKMGSRGAVPRLLRLKPEDVARTQGKPFAKGKFTWITEAGSTERWIVAQVGNYSVRCAATSRWPPLPRCASCRVLGALRRREPSRQPSRRSRRCASRRVVRAPLARQ